MCVGHGLRDGGRSRGATLAERWNGTTWTIQSAPNPWLTARPGGSTSALVR